MASPKASIGNWPRKSPTLPSTGKPAQRIGQGPRKTDLDAAQARLDDLRSRKAPAPTPNAAPKPAPTSAESKSVMAQLGKADARQRLLELRPESYQPSADTPEGRDQIDARLHTSQIQDATLRAKCNDALLAVAGCAILREQAIVKLERAQREAARTLGLVGADDATVETAKNAAQAQLEAKLTPDAKSLVAAAFRAGDALGAEISRRRAALRLPISMNKTIDASRILAVRQDLEALGPTEMLQAYNDAKQSGDNGALRLIAAAGTPVARAIRTTPPDQLRARFRLTRADAEAQLIADANEFLRAVEADRGGSSQLAQDLDHAEAALNALKNAGRKIWGMAGDALTPEERAQLLADGVGDDWEAQSLQPRSSWFFPRTTDKAPLITRDKPSALEG